MTLRGVVEGSKQGGRWMIGSSMGGVGRGKADHACVNCLFVMVWYGLKIGLLL